jgi:flagellar hook-basal body complex protein FliE
MQAKFHKPQDKSLKEKNVKTNTEEKDNKSVAEALRSRLNSATVRVSDTVNLVDTKDNQVVQGTDGDVTEGPGRHAQRVCVVDLVLLSIKRTKR